MREVLEISSNQRKNSVGINETKYFVLIKFADFLRTEIKTPAHYSRFTHSFLENSSVKVNNLLFLCRLRAAHPHASH
jgi:hypothetical protein